MLSKQVNPIAWVMLLYKLADAQEAIESLLKDMLVEAQDFDEVEFRVHMAHIYSHLNRAWNARNATDAQHDDNAAWEEWNKFPTDLDSSITF